MCDARPPSQHRQLGCIVWGGSTCGPVFDPCVGVEGGVGAAPLSVCVGHRCVRLVKNETLFRVIFGWQAIQVESEERVC